VHQRTKNWHYGGAGWGKFVNTLVVNDETPLEREADARTTRAGSVIGGVDPESPVQVVDATWLLAQHGIAVDEARIGPVASWRSVERVEPIERIAFREDFETVAAGWLYDEGVRHLAVRGDELVARIGKTRGRIGRSVDWDLRDPEREYVLALDISAEELASAQVLLERDGDTLSAPIRVAEQSDAFDVVVVTLPPGRYTGLLLEGTPIRALQGASPRLRLCSATLMAIPRAGSTR
jgi:hypothetical protein